MSWVLLVHPGDAPHLEGVTIPDVKIHVGCVCHTQRGTALLFRFEDLHQLLCPLHGA